MSADQPLIGLSEAIRTLRAQLAEAMAAGDGEELRFRAGPVELEFLLEVSKEGGAGGGVRFWVVSLEGKGGVTRAETHRVRLTLTPETAAGEDVRVTDRVISMPR